MTGLSAETLGGVLSFQQSVGLVGGARGKYAVTPGGWSVAEMWKQDQPRACLLLQELFLKQWPARLALDALRDAPVPQEELARRLQGKSAGNARKGRYLVDWLVLALVVHRDASALVYPSSALLSTSRAWRVEPQPRSGSVQQLPRQGVLMGMTHSELRALPPQHYMAVLDNVAALAALDRVG
ncbi:hypothetical protein [Streptomyces flavidovirens]